MAKRYLSLDEAAQKLGIGKEELNRLREKGEIRGFADRGTFKFKEDDIDELGRRLQPSSDPDVPMIDAHDDGSVLDDEPAAEGSGLDSAPSIIRRLSGGAPSSSADSGEASGSIFDDFGPGGASDSDVQLVMHDRSDAGHDGGEDVLLQLQESDSDVRLSNDSDSNVKINLSDSDSDVRLSPSAVAAGGSAIKLGLGDSDSDVRLDEDSASRLAMPDSDSDVQLAPDAVDSGPLSPKPDSDSDVMLVSEEPDSDSDVHLAGDEDSGINFGLQSDSDVRLVAADSDSDVRLLDDVRLASPKSKIKKDSDSDVAVLPDSGVNLETPTTGKKSGFYSEGSSVLLDDSDIALDQGSGISLTSQSGINLVGPQSGIKLDRVADSGVSLEKKSADDDSGLALFDEDSEGGITLENDSGIALQADDDSGISISSDEEEGGITLAEAPGDSGISLKDDEDLQLTETMPAMKIPKGKKKPADDDSISDTMLEVPSVSAEEDLAESDFEIGAADGSSHGDTSVLLFDDEDETDDGGAAMVKKKASDEEEEEAFEFSESDEEATTEETEGEEVEDVFAGDEAFEEESEFESEGEFEPAAKVAVAGAIEYPWGAGLVSTLAVSSIAMLFCGMASIDLVRSMWGHQGYSPANGWLIEILGGLFK